MKRRLAVLGVTALALAALTGPAAASPGQAAPETVGAAALHPRIIATFPGGDFGAFAESLAIDRAGNVYTAVTEWTAEGWNRGQVWKTTPAGRTTAFGPELDVGILTGLAFDDDGRLYAGLVTWDDPALLPAIAPGVLRIGAHGATRVLTLPSGEFGVASFPNGLAFHDGSLYVSDSIRGVIWRTRPHGTRTAVPSAPWYQDARLAPSVDWEGINGIAFKGDVLHAVVADTGLVVRVPVRPRGAPGVLTVLADDPALRYADGVAFDARGGLWVAVNPLPETSGGSLVRVTPWGAVRTVAHNPGWLNYPTQPAFGTTPGGRHTLYVANGALNEPEANVIRLRVWVRGAMLP